MDPQAANEIFPHIRIVIGMVVGLGITRLLTGIARLIQHPKRHRLSVIHLLWVFSLLAELALFWWWEFALSRLPSLTFATFLFLIVYALVLFLLCALLHDVAAVAHQRELAARRHAMIGGCGAGRIPNVECCQSWPSLFL